MQRDATDITVGGKRKPRTGSENPVAQFDGFTRIHPASLRLEGVDELTFVSHHVWCPAGRRIMYGGQLVAHVVEAAHRTVNCRDVRMHSLRITFASPGRAIPGAPVTYGVSRLRDGRSFTLRSVRVTQRGKLLLVAVASFHTRGARGDVYAMAPPRFARGSTAQSTKAAFQERLTALIATQTPVTGASRKEPTCSAEGSEADLAFLNVFTPPDLLSSYSKDVWMRVLDSGVKELARQAGIPQSRIHLIIACWLSDVIVALAGLFPHGYPDVDVQMMASLDHCLYMHETDAMNVADWFAFEVRSSWAGNSIALNHGRLYGGDGTLWLSVAQQTVARLGPTPAQASAKPLLHASL